MKKLILIAFIVSAILVTTLSEPSSNDDLPTAASQVNVFVQQ